MDMKYNFEEDKQTRLIGQIETTINYRSVKAKRLLKNESFIQHINILYSCFGAVLSILSLLIDYKFISFMATIISIILVVSITYLNSQRYAARAKDLDANILDLRNLYAELSIKLSEEKLLEKEKIYNSYLAASETEDTYDKLYHDIFEYTSNKESSVEKFRYFQFFAMLFLRLLLRSVIVCLPFIITLLLFYSIFGNGTCFDIESLNQIKAEHELL